MSAIADRLALVRQQVQQACLAAGRDPADVTLVAVSKGQPAAAIRAAYDAGQRHFGENYPAEFKDKRAELADLDIRWHFIGHVQRNKIKWVAAAADLVHTLHDEAGIAAWDKRAAAIGSVQDVLLQVNVAGETSKRGCTPEDAAGLAEQIVAAPSLRLRGAMTMPPFDHAATPYFRALAEIAATLPGIEGPPVLSMGMSGDFAEAIACGSTHVRVGTAIFGPRQLP